MTRQYNDPNAVPSDIGQEQLNDLYYQKKAIIDASKDMFFTQIADTVAMPKHMGKTIKRYHYLPLLADANINDQGIDAQGVTTTRQVTIVINTPENVGDRTEYVPYYAVGTGVDVPTATTEAQTQAIRIFQELGLFDTDYATSETAALAASYEVDTTIADVPVGGNLYGSARDIGVVTGKMPVLSENGGRVNRVGFRRIEVEGTIEKMGFFDEYTKESMDFDSDADLMMHINREMVKAASQINEDLIQIDLLNGAGIIRYGGAATSTATVTGDGTDQSLISEITYDDLMRLAIELDNNRTPKQTKIIAGSRMIDTKVIEAARYMYIGSELEPMFKNMKDNHGNPAFVKVSQYADAGNIAMGEIGAVDQFRIIVVPEMLWYEGVGADANDNQLGYRETNGKYDVFPALVVGDQSFTTIGFQTDGKTSKFKIKHAKPESTESYANDPYGETGFMSIKWYYGSMILRPERIALLKCVAKW